MLTAIRFENFQGFKGEVECRIAPITLVFGPNASGKSSFRRALETLRLAYVDEARRCEDSNLPKKLDYLSYGWTKGISGARPFGLGLVFEGEISGVTESYSLVPSRFEVGVTFANADADLTLEHLIEYAPGGHARVLDFEIVLDDNGGISDEVRLAACKALTIFVDQLDALVDTEVTGVRDTLKIPAPTSRYRDSVDEAIEALNNSQPFLKYNRFLRPPENYLSWCAKYLVELLEQGLEKYLDKEVMVQSFIYSKNNGKLQFDSVATHVRSVFSDEEDTKSSEERDRLLSEEVSQNMYTRGFLLDWGEDDSDPWDLYIDDSRDGTIWKFQRALSSNSDLARSFICEKFRVIEPWRGVPAEEAQGDISELPSSSAVAKMNDALGRITNNRYLFQFENEVGVRSSRNIRTVLDTFTGVTLPYGDVGTGLSQLLPILYDLATESSGLTYIEQPELHLHPRAQGALMDVILDSWLEEENQEGERQFILETHSESMLLRLQKRIRNGDIRSEDVAVVFVDSVSPAESPDGRGYNNISELALDNLGDVLDPFPVSFVSMRLEDLL